MGPERQETRRGAYSQGVLGAPEREQLYRNACNSERIIAEILDRFIDAEASLSEAEQLAGEFGYSMTSALLMGLMYPQTDEAKRVIEKAFARAEYPDHSEGLNECLRTFGTVAEDSSLPKLVAQEILGFRDRDPEEFDPLPSRLKFFAGCSAKQIAEFLEPLAATHPHEVTRQRIQSGLLELQPRRISIDPLAKELLEISRQEDLGYSAYKRAQYLMDTLGLSQMPRENLTTLIETALGNVSLVCGIASQHHGPWVIESMLKVLNKLESSSEHILVVVRAQIQEAATLKDSPTIEEQLRYVKRCDPLGFEATVREFLQARTEAPSSRDQWYYAEKSALALLDAPSEPETVVLLGRILMRGYLLSEGVSESLVVDRIARSPHTETKGEIISALQKSLGDLISRCEAIDRNNDDRLRYKVMESLRWTSIAKALVAGGFGGDKSLEVLSSYLKGDCTHASAEQVFAARLLAGHVSAQAEQVLMEALYRVEDSDLKMVLATSLSRCRTQYTGELLTMLWSDNLKESRFAARAFLNTHDAKEISALSLVFHGALEKVKEGDSAALELCRTIVHSLLETPGKEVDQLLFSALNNGGELASEVYGLCFPNEKRYYLRYRPAELLVGVSMLILETPTAPFFLKNKALEVLWPHILEKDVQSFISKQSLEEVDERLSMRCQAMLVGSLQPDCIKSFLHAVDFRYKDPSNRPTADIDEWWRRKIQYFAGDTRLLAEAMKGFVMGKKRANLVS
jgi:hypothetical protein